jgi:hypothetical protein
MTQNIIDIKPEGNISVCPHCGYKDGFHVSFDIDPDSKKAKVILICPDCHNRFKIGWTVFLEE